MGTFQKSIIGSALIIGVLVALAFRTEIGRVLLTGRWSYVERVSVDRGTYFRIKVKLAYKGEPQDFDIVVGCNVKVTQYKGGGGSTYEAGVIPLMYGRAMPDGKAVVVLPPDACGSQTTANSLVPPNFLPLVVVYDDAKLMTF